MKKLSYISLLLFGVGMFFSNNTNAQVVISVRPVWHEEVHHERPPAPGPHHVWVDDEWHWDRHGHKYGHVNGHWQAERHDRVWVSGHWAAAPGGEEWHQGHWSRRD